MFSRLNHALNRYGLAFSIFLVIYRNWDARRSTSASLEAVAKLVKERPDSFEEKTAKRASIAAAPLAAWVLANLQYGQILQQVAPLEREQRQLAEYVSPCSCNRNEIFAMFLNARKTILSF